MSKADLAQDKTIVKKAFKQHDSQEHKGGKGTTLKLKKGGSAGVKIRGTGAATKGVTARGPMA